MFVAFTGAPKITRIYGKGEVIVRKALFREDYKAVRDAFQVTTEKEWDGVLGARSIILCHVDRVTASCGFSIPKYDFVKDRNTLNGFCEKLGVEGLKEYRAEKNSFSIDGLRSVAQVQQGATPGKRIYVYGYYHADYSGSLLSKLLIQLQMIYASGLYGHIREVLAFFAGISVTLVLLKLHKARFKVKGI